MTKRKENKRIKLEDDYTKIGLVVAVGISIFILFFSVLMLYISTPPEKIYVAKVNEKGIMRVDYDRALNNTKRMYTQMLKMDFTDPKNQAQLDTIKKNSVDSLINKEIFLQYAEKNSVYPDKDAVDLEIEKIKKENFNGEDKPFKDYIRSISSTIEQFRDSIYKDKTVEKIRKQIVDEKVKITDKETKEYYDKNLAEFKTKEQVQASHILVKEESKAKEIYDELQKDPKKFDELAKKNSVDPGSKDKGGDLGFFGKGQMVAEFEKTAWALEKDQISEPVKTQFGFHIIKKIAHKDEKQDKYEDVKKKIEDNLKQKQSNDVLEKFIKEQKALAKIEMYDGSTPVVAISSTPSSPTGSASATSSSAPTDKKDEAKKDQKVEENKKNEGKSETQSSDNTKKEVSPEPSK